MDSRQDLIPEIGYFVQRRANPLWRMDERTITFHDISYIVSGKAQYEIDGQSRLLCAGDVIYAAPGQARLARATGEGFTVYAMNFSLLQEPPDYRLPLPTFLHVGRKEALLTLFDHLQQAWIGKGASSLLRTRAYGELILSFLLDAAAQEGVESEADARIRQAAAYLAQHLTENVTVAEVAEQVGLTPDYFSSLFKKATGETLKQYQIHLRLNYAEKLLRSGQCNVSEAAQDSGFCDVYYFSRLFTRFKGIRPSQVKAVKGNLF